MNLQTSKKMSILVETSLKLTTLLPCLLICFIANFSPFTKAYSQNAALNFDGNNDYLYSNIDELATGNTTHTIEAWLYIDALPSTRTWPFNLGQYNTGAHHWLLEADGDFVVGVFNNGAAQTSTNLTSKVGSWVHLATVFDGTTLSLYVDGTLTSQVAATFNFMDKHLYTGRPFFSGEDYFNGAMDEIRIWSTARTSSQIANNREQALNGNESGLLAYYDFQEGTPNGDNTSIANVLDRSPNNNNCSINNFAKSGTSSNWILGPINVVCAQTGNPCDDGNPYTNNDVYDMRCNCIGQAEHCWTIQDPAHDVGDGSSAGFYFPSITIPKYATIKYAYLQQTAASIINLPEAFGVTYMGLDAQLYPTVFGSGSDASNRLSYVFPQIEWNQGTWFPNESGAAQRSSNLVSDIQWRVNANGWTGDHPIAIMVENWDNDGYLPFKTYEDNPAQATQLCLTYNICNLTGTFCDDGNAATYNDRYNGDCECKGVPIQNGCTISCYSGPMGFNLEVEFAAWNTLCCVGTNYYDGDAVTCGPLKGEVHIAYDEYIKGDTSNAWWYAEETTDCDSDGRATVIRGRKRFTEGAVARYGNVDYSLYFQETWDILSCGGDIEVEVFVYKAGNAVAINTNPISSGTYQTYADLTSSGTVDSDDVVDFRAGNSITLQEGFTVAAGGTFSAKLEPQTIFDCADIRFDPFSSNDLTIQQPSINKLEIANTSFKQLTVTPNLINETATIQYELSQPESVTIGLFTISGQKMETLTVNSLQTTGKHTLELVNNNYPKGVYFVQLLTTTNKLVQKVVIQ